MHKFNNRNFLHNLGVVLFMASIAFVLVAARKATASPADADNTFAMKAASGGMSEVKLGQLAAEKGTNPVVKQPRLQTRNSFAPDSKNTSNKPRGTSTVSIRFSRLSAKSPAARSALRWLDSSRKARISWMKTSKVA